MKAAGAKPEDQAHRRLLNSVISFIGADQYGSSTEVREAAIELEAARQESQAILHPELTTQRLSPYCDEPSF